MEHESLSGSSPDRPRFRPPAGLFGMVALIVAIELAIPSQRTDLVTPWADDWRISAEAARSKAKDAEILCFGDSLVKYGVMPRVIEARSGLKAYNLATSGGTMASSYFLFRQAIEAGARPKAVVVDVAALMFLEQKPTDPLNFAELGTWRDCVDLAWTTRESDLLGILVAAKLLPSYRWRFEIRQNILAALEGRSSSQRQLVTAFQKLWTREAGAQPTPAERSHHPQENTFVLGVCPAQWACDPKDRAYAERFLTLADQHQVRVYWLIPPLSPIVHQVRATLGTDARYDRFVQTIASRHPSTMILDARPSGYDDTVHMDHLHLNRKGATILSADLADVMLEELTADSRSNASRRTLPPLAGRTGDEPIRSIARSRNSPPVHGTLR